MKIKVVFLAIFVIAASVFAQVLMESFFEDFNNAGVPPNFRFDMSNAQGINRNVWESGVASAVEPQTRVIRLDIHPDNPAGAWQGPNFNTPSRTLYGRYSTRVRIPDVSAQPNVGAVVGFYTYFNDYWQETPTTICPHTGLVINSEIDIEWLIAHPQLIYLTAWTHFTDGGNFRKIGRIINMATGDIISTTFGTSFASDGTPLTGVENQPTTIRAIPDFDASKNFYTYGFDWRSDNIRWWILNPENEQDTIVLWNYREPENRLSNESRITHYPANFMINFWHTNDWPAEGMPQSIQAPNRVFSAEFDWVRYERLEDIVNPIRITERNISSSQTNKAINASIFNRQLDLSFPTNVQNADVALYDTRGRLLFQRDIKVNGNFASLSIPKTIVRNQAAILQVKTNNINLTKQVLFR